MPNFAIRHIWGCWLQYYSILCSNSNQKIPKEGIFSPKFNDFYFCTKLCNKVYSRVLISNMTMVFQSCCLKHPIKTILVLNLRIFIFASKFAIRQIGGCLFPIWQSIFRIPNQKYPNKAFFVLNVSNFYFSMKLHIMKNVRVLISNFSNSGQKISK